MASNCELRVIGYHRIAAGKYGLAGGTQAVDPVECFAAAEQRPLRPSLRNVAVETYSLLQVNPGQTCASEVTVFAVQVLFFRGKYSTLNLYSGFAQPVETATADLRIRINRGGENTADSGCDNSFGTGGRPLRASAVTAGFEGDV